MSMTSKLHPSEPIKSLGLRWNPATDAFGFSVNSMHQATRVHTKRTVSRVSRECFFRCVSLLQSQLQQRS